MRELLSRFAGPDRRQFLRYLLVGGWNTAFGYAVYAGFTYLFTRRWVHGYMLAYLCAFVTGVASAFLLYKHFVFRTKGNALREFLRTNAVYGVTNLVGFLALPILVALLTPFTGAPAAPYLAQAILIPLTVLGSFVGHRRFSFARPPEVRDDPPAG